MATKKAATVSLALSGPQQVDLSVYRGDSGKFRLTVQEVGGTPIDVTNATWDADIRYKADDPDPITSFDIELVDTSTIDVVLSADKSAMLDKQCVYDVEMTLVDKVTTLVKGSITVDMDVSRE